jgi:glycosyltransferase involved in cell wall biosynthesis
MNSNIYKNNSIETQFNFACIWEKKGKLEITIPSLKKIISEHKDFVPAYKKLGNIYTQQMRLDEAHQILEKAIILDPNDAEAHKEFINVMILKDGISQAFDFYKLERVDRKLLDIWPNEILCCVAVRNEAQRLPWFLNYYRRKGVTKFLVVDNLSDDKTIPLLLKEKHVYIWRSEYSFNKANFGSVWFELLLRRYGVGNWCIIVDVDEMLVYPDCENKSLSQLCWELDQKNKKVMVSILLDMYSDKPISETYYETGQDLLEVCRYFDKQFYHNKFEFAGPFNNQTFYFGGIRQRIFGKSGEFCLSKISLLKYNQNFILGGGQHWTNRPVEEIADETGCLLHFKFLSTFKKYAEHEIERKQHYDGAMQYRKYFNILSSNDALQLFNKKYSIKYENSEQLVKLGIMQRDTSIEASASNNFFTSFPDIEIAINTERPFWSVMITTYNRIEFFENALKSVVLQFSENEDVQIEVINDGADKEVQSNIRKIIESAGFDNIGFYAPPVNMGHPEIFNLCIRRAKGEFVHILHDDDWVGQDFYVTLRRSLEKNFDVGAAFCRFAYANEEGEVTKLSWLERETPGIIKNWLDRIAIICRLQTPAIVVRRSVYEKLGGYSAAAGSVFDWEMWKRIAVNYPVWFEPKILAYFREHAGSESSEIIRSGQQIIDSLRAIEISSEYLPEKVTINLTKKARNAYALYALKLAKSQICKGDYFAAYTNISAGLICSQSALIKEALVQMLQNVKV